MGPRKKNSLFKRIERFGLVRRTLAWTLWAFVALQLFALAAIFTLNWVDPRIHELATHPSTQAR